MILRIRPKINLHFQVSRHSHDKTRGGRIASYLTNEQRSHAGWIGASKCEVIFGRVLRLQRHTRGSRKNAGMAYVAILVLLVIISTLAFTLLFKAGTGMLATMTRGNSMQAHYLAECAANHAMWRLLNDSNFPVADDSYYMHTLGNGRYGYKVRRHTDTTFATVATVGAVGKNVVQQSYVLYVFSQKKLLYIYFSDTDNHCVRKVNTETGSIDIIAGTLKKKGYSGDNGPATGARLNKPNGLHIDGNGNIYIADTDNHRIRKVNTEGTITTIVGTGSQGYSGNGGPAIGARLNKPNGLHIDGNGNIYIADTDNHRIRKIDTEGTITTIAGTGSQGYSGDNRPATGARLNKPNGLYIDKSGNMYIADTDNHRIRKVNTEGTITTIAGTGSQGYSGDNGPATIAKLNNPNGLYIDGNGNMYIADTDNHCIRKVDAETEIITTVVETDVKLNKPHAVFG